MQVSTPAPWCFHGHKQCSFLHVWLLISCQCRPLVIEKAACPTILYRLGLRALLLLIGGFAVDTQLEWYMAFASN